MTLKGDAKFKRKLTRGLKMTRNIVSFHTSSRKSESLHFDELLLFKAYKVLDEKYRRVLSNDNKEWPKEKLILEKYIFFVWCNRFETVSGRYS